MKEAIIKEIEKQTSTEWDAFVKDSPQGNLFVTFGWKNLIDSGTPFTQRIYGVFKKEKICGGVVLTEKRQLGKKVALNALLCPYLGFVLAPPISSKFSDRSSKQQKTLSALIQYLRERYSQIDLINAPELNDIRPFTQSRWKTAPRYTFYLDVSDSDQLWKSLDGSVRRSIKKAEESGLNTGLMECSPDEIFALLDKTLGKKGKKNPIPYSLVREIVTSEIIKNQRAIIGARTNQGELISAIVCVWDWQRAYYLIAATHPERLSTGVSSLLIWKLAGFLSKLPSEELDFIGGNIPSIARFKETFNPRLITHFRTEHWPSIMFKIIKKSGQFLLGR